MTTQAFTIAEAAKAVGVSVKTLRRYEAAGIVPPASRARNGYRIYTAHDLKKLKAIIGPMPRISRKYSYVLEEAAAS